MKWDYADYYIFFYYGKVWVVKNSQLWSVNGSTNCQYDTYDINKEFEKNALLLR